MLQVRNNHFISDTQYQEEIENLINKYFTEHTGKYEYMLIPINSCTYHNNGAKIFPLDVCRRLVNLLKAHGYYCYLTKPSWAYSHWMDFCVSSYIRSNSENIYPL